MKTAEKRILIEEAERRLTRGNLSELERALLEVRRQSLKVTASVSIDLDKKYSEEEYLHIVEIYPEFKIEYRYGRLIICMSDPEPEHAFIADELSTKFKEVWREKQRENNIFCKYSQNVSITYEDSAMQFSNNRYWRKPDLIRICNPIKTRKIFVNGTATKAFLNPDIIVEIVSTSSEKDDMVVKAKDYLQIESLKFYLVINYKKGFVKVFPKRDRAKTYYKDDAFMIEGALFKVSEILSWADFTEDEHEHLKIIK